jgi:hypothetical protein
MVGILVHAFPRRCLHSILDCGCDGWPLLTFTIRYRAEGRWMVSVLHSAFCPCCRVVPPFVPYNLLPVLMALGVRYVNSR